MVPSCVSPGVIWVRTFSAYQPLPASAIIRPQVWRSGMYM